jgi:hypothetical protein
MRSREPRWRHPELQPGWIDRPHRKIDLGDLALESGEVIPDFEISYVTHGTRSPAGDNTILVLTAIGSIHHRLDFLIGPGRPLDPDHHFIICADAIGNGMTTSPSNSRTRPDLSFPRFVITNRTPLALGTVPTGSVPTLVANAVTTARNAGPDPVDWVYQSWAYDAHDVGTTRASAATRPQPCDRSGRLRCFWFRNWTSTIRSKMRSRLLR